jgi:hypothetical protein
LMMEAIFSFETPVLTRAALPNIPEDGIQLLLLVAASSKCTTDRLPNKNSFVINLECYSFNKRRKREYVYVERLLTH